MTLDRGQIARRSATMEAYLLGQVDYRHCLALQQRLVYETTGRCDGQISLLLAEHFPCITVGRQGSRAHIRLGRRELLSRRLDVHWVNRGGGCLVHAPGQLAVYPMVPLDWHGFTVGDYLGRFQAGILAALEELGFKGQTFAHRYGIWGRAGQVVTFGAAVKSWGTYHGAYVNVSPAISLLRGVLSDPVDHTSVSSLAIERQRPVRMPGVRERLVRHLTAAFGCDRYHLYTGHPLLARTAPESCDVATHVG